jgi:hypothetical protein
VWKMAEYADVTYLARLKVGICNVNKYMDEVAIWTIHYLARDLSKMWKTTFYHISRATGIVISSE